VAFGGSAQASANVTVTPPAAPPPASSCFGGVFPSGATWSADGGVGQVTLSAPAGCEWSAAADVAWLIPLQTSGTGSAVLSYAIDANTSGAARSGTLNYSGTSFVVTQTDAFTNAGNGSPGGVGGGSGSAFCAVSASPFYVLFGSGGATRDVTIAAAQSCVWSVRSHPAWLQISTSQGMGAMTLSLTASLNADAAFRTGAVQIGERTLLVEQNGTGDDGVFSSLSEGVFAADPWLSFAWNRDEILGRVSGNIVVSTPVPGPPAPTGPTIYPPHDPEPGRTPCAVPKFVGHVSPYRGCTKNDDPAEDGETGACYLPVNFRERNRSSASGDHLHFGYDWDSSSGDLADLSSCKLGEEVSYFPNPAPSPPFDPYLFVGTNPIVKVFDNGSKGFFDDEHLHANFVQPYREATVIARQMYWYKCPCAGDVFTIVAGPHDIVRTVSASPDGSWKYTISKQGLTLTIVLPQ
jgi:hypothetical protein